jgi:hypothetical protein
MKQMTEKEYADILENASCGCSDRNPIHHTITENVTINEHRAPTVESVKFLKELQDEAEKNVISRGKLADNFMEAQWVHMHDFASFTEWVHCRFKLNGKEFNFKFEVERFPKTKLIEHIISSIKEKVAEVLICDFAGSEAHRNISR